MTLCIGKMNLENAHLGAENGGVTVVFQKHQPEGRVYLVTHLAMPNKDILKI